MSLFEPIRNFYGRFERPISSFSLVAGFVFDALTLKRVDTLFENLWILAHLIVVAIFIILIHQTEVATGDEHNPSRRHFWYVNILQFFFGGILSTYLVFYFRSSDIFTTWPFIALLILAFWANESLKKHYVRLSFQIILFFLSIYSFMIFLIPIVLHEISSRIFLFSGVVSLAIISLFTFLVFQFIKNKKEKFESKRMIIALILLIFIVVNGLYFTNLIPPIPLSLKDAEVLHSISRNADGNYDVIYEDHGWKGYFMLYPDFHEVSGQPVYAYSAVFSPKGLNIKIIHEWQHYDQTKKKWITEGEITLSVIGGRDGGFRTYSTRSNLADGKWRVNIKTENGQTIGHLRFNVVSVDKLPQTISSDLSLYVTPRTERLF
jgi:hypothetical protein